MGNKDAFSTDENYRFSSVGYIKVYGNSVEIKEHNNTVPKEAIKNEIKRENKHVEHVNHLLEMRFQEHVLEHGHDYDKHSFWFNGKIYFPQHDEGEIADDEKPLKPTPKRERGDITGLSQKSRYRMMKKMNQINPDEMETLYSLTLTYPSNFPTDGVTHKTDLDVFLKRLKRRFNETNVEIEYLWKLEFQKRGAPHYHIIVNLPKVYKVDFLRKWLLKNWYEVAQRFWDEKDEKHSVAGIELQKIKNIRSASHYLCKYLTKELDVEVKNQGRYWGCSRNWGTLLHEAELTGRQLIWFRRIVKRFTKKQHTRMAKMISLPLNLTVFGYWKVFVQALEWVEKVH